MPELLEIEMYRRGAAPLIGRTVSSIETPDDWYIKGVDPETLQTALLGATIESLGRVGKLMLIETVGATVGLRFGMTGILMIDEQPVIAELEYSSNRLDLAWNRFVAHFADGGQMAMNDPRRLGGVELDPDLTKLGPDAWSIGAAELQPIFGRYKVAAKALLLNQKRIAGLGNLLVDELLWRSGVSPLRPANEVSYDAIGMLGEALAPMLDELYQRGGSTCGDHFEERNVDGRCPRDGGEMVHATVGGRSTWWCRTHQF
ncbi:MAG: DNA-formamidopyrimidine glycosylase family protein [Acidimicrobiales bacterium]|nr:DNA-formamidopyrimidine glycosylase family protein [Acidimicrobiales bacterium]